MFVPFLRNVCLYTWKYFKIWTSEHPFLVFHIVVCSYHKTVSQEVLI